MHTTRSERVAVRWSWTASQETTGSELTPLTFTPDRLFHEIRLRKLFFFFMQTVKTDIVVDIGRSLNPSVDIGQVCNRI